MQWKICFTSASRRMLSTVTHPSCGSPTWSEGRNPASGTTLEPTQVAEFPRPGGIVHGASSASWQLQAKGEELHTENWIRSTCLSVFRHLFVNAQKSFSLNVTNTLVSPVGIRTDLESSERTLACQFPKFFCIEACRLSFENAWYDIMIETSAIRIRWLR